MARPTKYKPEYPEALINHMSQGKSFEAFAAFVGVCDDTLREWCKVYPEFSAAKKRGWMLSMAWWEDVGRNSLFLGEKEKFNSTVWIYTMKCRFARYWGEKQEVAHVIDDKREIKKLSNDELNVMLLEADEGIRN